MKLQKKIQEYPGNEFLLYCIAICLDTLLIESELPPEKEKYFENTILSWYEKLSSSKDTAISNSAYFMLANKYINIKSYDKAQEIIDRIPERENKSVGDKYMLQATLDMEQGNSQQAIKNLQQMLLNALNKVQIILYRLLDCELSSHNIHTAEIIADRYDNMTKLFELMEYSPFLLSLQIALAEKNAEKTIDILRGMFVSMLKPWKADGTALFYNLENAPDNRAYKNILAVALTKAEKDKEYTFLRNNNDFKVLLDEYREKTI